MRLLPISMCRPEMRLGKRVHNEEGLVLLEERFELTETILRKLERRGIQYLYIEDPRTDDIVVQDPISDETRRVAMSAIRTNFKWMMANNLSRKSASAPYISKAFKDTVTMLVDDLSRNPDAMVMLTDIGITDLYLYQHSLNVSIYSIMMGLAEGYSRDQITALGYGSLLHDIGKTRIPLEILQKPGRLDDAEFETMKKHAEYGYLMLKDEPNLPLISAHCALQHHERLNGSGYPRGIKEKEIHEFAKWIGIADSYDAMTTNRVYRNAMLPHQAMEALYAGSGSLYDQRMVEAFRNRVALYPLGVTVKLNTGETGVVVDVNSHSPQRPVVRILEDPDGQSLSAPYEIDLSKHLSVMVVEVGEIKPASAG